MLATHPALTKLSDRHVHMCFSLLWQTADMVNILSGQLWVYIKGPGAVFTQFCVFLMDSLMNDSLTNTTMAPARHLNSV